MKIVVYGPERRVGALQGEGVIDLHSAFAKYVRETQDEPRPYELASAVVPSDLGGLIESGPRGLENSQKAIEYLVNKAQDQTGLKGERIVHSVSQVKLHPPLASRASRIMMAGGNYADHLQGIRLRRMREELTIEQILHEARNRGFWGFWKIAVNAVGPGDDVIYPARTQRLDYEAEVAAVLSKRAKDVPESKVHEYFWGYTMSNDWSARDQKDIPPYNFAMGKNFDSSSSLGPCIVVAEVKDPQNIPFETKVNGEVRQRGNTKDMIFSFAEYISWLSRDQTLLPGDMFSAGTCAGTALDSSEYDENGVSDPKLFVKPGDVVEISSPLIGTLRNRIVAKS